MNAAKRKGTAPDREGVRDYVEGLQARICQALEAEEPSARFGDDPIDRGPKGFSRPRVLRSGSVIEQAAVNFTHTRGAELPASASQRRPELAGLSYEAISISLIVHPRNPYAPTSHANFRFFVASPPGQETESVWWFGGGFDLTPYYGFKEDVIHWHKTARDALSPWGEDLYPRFKVACDEYFFLPHRGEARGIGGIFFDDFADGGFDRAFGVVRSAGDAYIDAYLPILRRRRDVPHGEKERRFQLMRRGRYVEFNLLYDRGTRFGLQAGGRTESILASLPPEVHWHYDWTPEQESPEARLVEDFLAPRDWLAAVPKEVDGGD